MHSPNPQQRRLWRFHGGIHLPAEKELSTGRPVAKAPLPSFLTIPVQQHVGAPALPLVRVGDWVLKGQRIAEPQGYMSAPVHASSSGMVVAVEERPVPHPSGLGGTCIVIRTDGLDQWARRPKPLENYKDLDASTLRERIRWAGIVGLGGAAFPTSVKLDPEPHQPIRTLILNGAECEPYITCDDMLMREHAGRIVQGASIVMHLLGARECLIGIEDNKPQAIAAMRLAVAESDIRKFTQVCAIPTLYPSGGEKQLIRALTGKEVPTKGTPAQIGILCQNVASLAAVAEAVITGKPPIARYITLSGRGIKEPRNFEVLIGTPVADLIRAAGGFAGEVRKLVLGGPMMGFTLNSEQVPVTKGTNCILALTDQEAPAPRPAQPCIRCGKCAEVCPVSLLPQQLYWYAWSKDLDKVRDYKLFDCIECGCCSQVCPSHIPLVQYYRYAKAEIRSREQDQRTAEHARVRYEARTARLERLEQARKAKLRRQQKALTARPATTDPAQAGPDHTAATQDPKQAAIEAAKARVAAKKAALAKQGMAPKNTRNLTPSQQRQIAAAEQRRRAAATAGTQSAGEG
ncbi:electron transport complex subunit RsxC [Candidatus Thiosymbion oneisti]|uniref:electron transport complex subunit RsxC n=1 Tax=Candidatus Thiosymbion oneisti TaxID=589554 RepID=UPI000B28619F|nr:electron transport complex subunit RsxC [Candidatus Thiosymbion oneisti]